MSQPSRRKRSVRHEPIRSTSISGNNDAEGVGFEPTVGCPTLDFESSALNRTQPPFPKAGGNVRRPKSNIQCRMQRALWNWRWALRFALFPTQLPTFVQPTIQAVAEQCRIDDLRGRSRPNCRN